MSLSDSFTLPYRFQIGAYDTLGLLGRGGSALVFAALQRRLYEAHGVHRKVALKVIWDLGRAHDELDRLSRLDAARGANNLIDYFETPYADLAPLLQTLLPQDEAPGHDTLLGVLVLQFAHGQSIMHAEPWDRDKPVPRGSWVIDTEDGPLRQYPALEMKFEEKVQFLRSLFKVLKTAHENQPPQVHGDLHPGNVVYNRADQEVILIDWGHKEICGTDGWLSPWHDRLALGECSALPPQADVFVMNLWIQRLVGDKLGPFAAGLSPKNEAGYTIGALHAAFEAGLARQSKRRLVPLLLIAASIGLMITLSLWRTPNAQMNEMVRIVDYTLAHPTEADTQLARLHKLRQSAVDETTRKAAVRAIGTITLKTQTISQPFLARIAFEKPDAVMLSPVDPFLVYDQWLFSIGSPVSPEEYVAEITGRGMKIADAQGRIVRTLAFPQHPLSLPREDLPKNALIIYKTSLNKLFMALAGNLDKLVWSDVPDTVTVFGIVLGETTSEILEDLCVRAGVPWRENSPLSIPAGTQDLALWEVESGHLFLGRFRNQLLGILEDQLGYQLEGLPDDFGMDSITLSFQKDRFSRDVLLEAAGQKGLTYVIDGHTITFHQTSAP